MDQAFITKTSEQMKRVYGFSILIIYEARKVSVRCSSYKCLVKQGERGRGALKEGPLGV